MRPLPTDNHRPAILLAILSGIAVLITTLTLTVWVQYQAADRGYTTELRGALRKYGDVAAVPRTSAVWLGRVHDRTPDQVVEDLAAAATDPSAFDFDQPLHKDPGLLIQLFLDHGFLGLWLLLSCAGLLGVAPLMIYVNRKAQVPRRRPGGPEQGWT